MAFVIDKGNSYRNHNSGIWVASVRNCFILLRAAHIGRHAFLDGYRLVHGKTFRGSWCGQQVTQEVTTVPPVRRRVATYYLRR